MLRFSIFGFRVTVHWMFWVSVALLGGGLDADSPRRLFVLALWVLAAFVSILLHELGHTFMQRRYGARAYILLYALGGLAVPDRKFTPRQHIYVSVAGPAAQITLGVVSWLMLLSIFRGSFTVGTFLASLTFVSIVWGVMNLIPIYPLDGGQVLLAWLGPSRSRLAFTVGMYCAIASAVLVAAYNLLFSAIFFGMLAYENFQRSRGRNVGSFLHPR
jgi:stage IV sporulation protein FB